MMPSQSGRNAYDEPTHGYMAATFPQPLYPNLNGLEFPLGVTV